MKKFAPLHLLVFASMILAAGAADLPVNGVYTGWETLPEMKGEAQSEWFRLHRLTIKGDALELLGDPVAIKNRELAFSASEGGFLVYKGAFYKKDGQLRAKFTAVTEDEDGEILETYGGVLAKEDVAIEVIDLVSFRMGGVIYTLQNRNPEPKRTNKAQN
jgi:hypothetical protein